MTPFEDLLLHHIAEICRDTGRPARTVSLAVRTGLAERTIKNWLARLERSGKVRRATPKTGWIAVGCCLDVRVCQAVERRQLDFFRRLGWDYNTAIRAVA